MMYMYNMLHHVVRIPGFWMVFAFIFGVIALIKLFGG